MTEHCYKTKSSYRNTLFNPFSALNLNIPEDYQSLAQVAAQ
jgi:hypothetical protein